VQRIILCTFMDFSKDVKLLNINQATLKWIFSNGSSTHTLCEPLSGYSVQCCPRFSPKRMFGIARQKVILSCPAAAAAAAAAAATSVVVVDVDVFDRSKMNRQRKRRRFTQQPCVVAAIAMNDRGLHIHKTADMCSSSSTHCNLQPT
jgi:hypothetical protein